MITDRTVRLPRFLSRLAVRYNAVEDGILAVVRYDLRAPAVIVLHQLGKALNDWYQCQPPRPACGGQRRDIKGRHGTQLVTEEHRPVLELAAMFIGYRRQLPCQVLYYQIGNKVFGGISFREFRIGVVHSVGTKGEAPPVSGDKLAITAILLFIYLLRCDI